MQPKDNQTPQGDNQIDTNAVSQQGDKDNYSLDSQLSHDNFELEQAVEQVQQQAVSNSQSYSDGGDKLESESQDSDLTKESTQLDKDSCQPNSDSDYYPYNNYTTDSDARDSYRTQGSLDNATQYPAHIEGDTVTKQYVDKAWRDRTGKSMLYVVFAIMLMLLVTLVVRLCFYCPVQVEQKSMYPTYAEGDRLWVYKTQSIERGQVVVFFEKGTGSTFLNFIIGNDRLIIKRAVAVAGDQIWLEQQADNSYIVCILPKDSDTVLHEDYYKKGDQIVQIPNLHQDDEVGLGMLQQHIGRENALTIDEGHFFAMGDNRPVSDDSRGSFGQIPYSHLLGVVEE